MWNKVYVEKDVRDLPRVQVMLADIRAEILEIDAYDDIWGKSKKPYLQKRETLNLFLAKKKGQLVKEAPNAYGQSGEPHYYFIHAYNCIYECQYCYLQGYFNTPDIVLFVNHEDIVEEMEKVLARHDGNVWFHAGEFSDSLALSHLSGELEIYHEFCRKHPRAQIELRTKSVNVKILKELKPLPNFVVSFSLSPEATTRAIDLKTPSLSTRLKVMENLKDLGFSLGCHFDPMIYQDGFQEAYHQLLKSMNDSGLTKHLTYLSLGVVRFTKDVHREVERNYPDSFLHATTMVKSSDNKVKYPHPLRHWMFRTVKELALMHSVPEEKIYLCMEDA